MTFADWFLPWRAKRRIAFLEQAIPKELVTTQAQLAQEKADHKATHDKLAKLNLEHQKTKAASAALGVWLKEVYRLDKVPPSDKVVNLLK